MTTTRRATSAKVDDAYVHILVAEVNDDGGGRSRGVGVNDALRSPPLYLPEFAPNKQMLRAGCFVLDEPQASDEVKC